VKEQERIIQLEVGRRQIAGTVISPEPMLEGMLFIHGWAGNQEQYLVRARKIAALGCVCLTFDLHGHAATSAFQATVTREENLADVVAAYDFLAGLPNVNANSIGVVGSSYGGYLAAILTALRPVQWLALRAAALYRDLDWTKPKGSLDRADLNAYRLLSINPAENRALEACTNFGGDVLLVESQHDTIVPSSVTVNYRTAFVRAHSLTLSVIEGADHALSDMNCQEKYTSLLTTWATEVILKARSSSKSSKGVSD
jgi:dienelactone hydrolase